MSIESLFDIHWATPKDEPNIRTLVSSVAMPGAVAVRFEREPNYFLGTTIMGDSCDVLLAYHRQDEQLAAMACRAERRAYINGQESQLGYIGQMRVAAHYRGHWLVNYGAKWFKEASSPDLIYFGVIARENPRARQYLVGLRPPAGLHNKHICGITTCAILLRPLHTQHTPGVEIIPGSTESLAEIVAFLRRQGARRQFFPTYTLEDFTDGAKMRGLKPEDILVARRNNAIVGVMAVWDQAAYKQDVVAAYGASLSRLRPVYDLAARFLAARPLTPPGKAIQLAFASCVCIGDDDPSVMRSLLSACLLNAYQRGKAFLMLGLPDNHTLLAIAQRYLHIKYHSDLFAVSWCAESLQQIDKRIPYIEISTL